MSERYVGHHQGVLHKVGSAAGDNKNNNGEMFT